VYRHDDGCSQLTQFMFHTSSICIHLQPAGILIIFKVDAGSHSICQSLTLITVNQQQQ